MIDRLGQLGSRLWASVRAGFGALLELRLLQAVLPLIGRLAEAGTQGYPPETKRRLMILNMIAYLIAITTLIYTLQQIAIDDPRYRPVVIINLALFFIMLAVPFMHRFGDIAGAMLIIVSEYAAQLAFTAFLGNTSGLHIQLIVIAAAAFVVFGLKRLWLIIPTIGVGLALHLAAWFWFPPEKALIAADRHFLDALYAQAAITTFGLIAASVFYAFRLAEAAKAETDALLRNILPDSIVERLKLKPTEPIADSFPEASILFADISGFVPLARRLGASQTVALLNSIVSEFDALSEHHGVEKIKTIGDAYMVAAGVPERVPDHVFRLACLALDMQEVLRRLREESKLDLNMRIGLASGPIMAGVIGRQKFSYDIWGDAVNLAARLENLSIPGRIHVCPRCRAELDKTFVFESRGIVEIKGVGQQETWFLLARRDGMSDAETEAAAE
jgi:adenylate cyclase